MDRARWQRVEALLEAAFDLPEPEQRAYLAAQCGDDDELRAEVEALLAGDRAAAGVLEEGVAPELLSALVVERDDAALLAPGTRVGPYRVLRLLGRGGMGEVYLAERVDGDFEQRVALKLIKRGMDTADVLRRFYAERRILARLEHPNIARLLDGGVGPDGRPYFAMEYVEGAPLSQWAQDRGLGVRARLRLFLEATAAVDYAHRQLVVHRDLKPSNILVRSDGRVVLLDFGVARLLQAEAEGQATQTDLGALVLTPAFAAPEQVRGEPVSTATDVYGLGAVLYQLLTAAPPLQPSSRSLVDVERAVLEQQPRAPRLLAPPLYAKLDDGWAEDLDTIVLKALRKSPEERYASATALADDLRRLLDGHPIQARAPGRLYRLRKFVGRHRIPVALAMLAFVLLVVGVLAVAWQAQQARRQADRAERVRDFVLSLFEGSDPNVAKGQKIDVRELLDRGARRISATLEDEPDLAAEFARTLAQLYEQNGLYTEAAAAAEQAMALARSGLGTDDPSYADAVVALAMVRHAQERFADAEALYREALQTLDAKRGGGAAETARARGLLAQVVLAQGRTDEADTLLTSALAALGPGGDELVRAALSNTLGRVRRAQGRYDDALALYRDALAIRELRLGGEHVLVAETTVNLAVTLEASEHYRDAAQLYEQALRIERRLLGPEHPYVAVDANNLANVLRILGRVEDAVALLRESVAISAKAHGGADAGTAWYRYGLAYALEEAGHHDEAIEVAGLALEHLDTGGDADALRRVVPIRLLRARAAARKGDLARADADLADALAGLGTSIEKPESAADYYAARGDVDCLAARYADAAAHYQRALQAQRQRREARAWATARMELAFGECLQRSGDPSGAAPHLDAALAGLEPTFGPSHPAVQRARAALNR